MRAASDVPSQSPSLSKRKTVRDGIKPDATKLVGDTSMVCHPIAEVFLQLC